MLNRRSGLNRGGVCYVLGRFPLPSETFVSDEIASLVDAGVTPTIFVLDPGDRSIVHPSAQRLFTLGCVRDRQPVSKAAALAALLRLLVTRPAQASRTLRHACASPDRWRYVQALQIAADCAAQRVAFIHAHFADESLLWAHAISRWTGIPYGVTTHRYDLLDDPIAPDLAARLFKEAHAVVTISEFNRRLMVDKYGLDAERIAIVHCGIALERFRPMARPPRTADAPLRLLNVARLEHVKGQDVLLRAVRSVQLRGRAVELTIVGDGSRRDDLQQLARDLGMAATVRFIGAQPQEIVLEQLHRADVFVMPSRSEGLPVACIEAMAVGLPLIATRIAGLPELVDDRINGVLVEPDDVAGLADAIAWVGDNLGNIGAMRDAARRRVEQDFERGACTRRLLAVMGLGRPGELGA